MTGGYSRQSQERASAAVGMSLASLTVRGAEFNPPCVPTGPEAVPAAPGRLSQPAAPVKIPLTRGAFALIDAADISLVSAYKWRLGSNGRKRYAVSTVTVSRGKYRTLYLHRLIFGDDTFQVVDHIDGDSLNNTRVNLRGCTHAENAKNKRAIKAISGFKGVRLHLNPLNWPRPWYAKICVDGQKLHLGSFATAEEAAKAYDAAARFYHGEFAATNAELLARGCA